MNSEHCPLVQFSKTELTLDDLIQRLLSSYTIVGYHILDLDVGRNNPTAEDFNKLNNLAAELWIDPEKKEKKEEKSNSPAVVDVQSAWKKVFTRNPNEYVALKLKPRKFSFLNWVTRTEHSLLAVRNSVISIGNHKHSSLSISQRKGQNILQTLKLESNKSNHIFQQKTDPTILDEGKRESTVSSDKSTLISLPTFTSSLKLKLNNHFAIGLIAAILVVGCGVILPLVIPALAAVLLSSIVLTVVYVGLVSFAAFMAGCLVMGKSEVKTSTVSEVASKQQTFPGESSSSLNQSVVGAFQNPESVDSAEAKIELGNSVS